jgi:hypothetical protein
MGGPQQPVRTIVNKKLHPIPWSAGPPPIFYGGRILICHFP